MKLSESKRKKDSSVMPAGTDPCTRSALTYSSAAVHQEDDDSGLHLLFVRHGKTAGNLRKRYIGSRTDEPLCEEGIRELQKIRASWTDGNEYGAESAADLRQTRNKLSRPAGRNGCDPEKGIPDVHDPESFRTEEKTGHSSYGRTLLFVSPMLRCRMTADILYPGLPQILIPGFRECDFGSFENKNYRELDGDPDYQRWIDSGGTLPFPGGESPEGFCDRTRRAFREVLSAYCGLTEEQFAHAQIRLVNTEGAKFRTLSVFQNHSAQADTGHVNPESVNPESVNPDPVLPPVHPQDDTPQAAPETVSQESESAPSPSSSDRPGRTCVFVVHGGTVMAILSDLLGGAYYDYQIENGGMVELKITMD